MTTNTQKLTAQMQKMTKRKALNNHQAQEWRRGSRTCLPRGTHFSISVHMSTETSEDHHKILIRINKFKSEWRGTTHTSSRRPTAMNVCMLMSAEANGGDVLAPPDTPDSVWRCPGEESAEWSSFHARAYTRLGFCLRPCSALCDSWADTPL